MMGNHSQSDPSLFDLISRRFAAAVISAHTYRGDATVTIRPEYLLDVAEFLKEDPSFQMNFLTDLTAVDYLTFGKIPPAKAAHFNAGVTAKPPSHIQDEAPWSGPATKARFEVVYHFFSLPLNQRFRLKVPVEESSPQVASVAHLWRSADWFEREAWDMYGITFKGHPNLKRLLMYPEFNGHPLRKDYPVIKRQPLIGPVN